MSHTHDFQTDFTGSYIKRAKPMHQHSSESQRHGEPFDNPPGETLEVCPVCPLKFKEMPSLSFSAFRLLSSQ